MATDANSIHDLELAALTGAPVPLSTFRGRLVLAVNVASRCGLTPQYTGLQSLHERYEGRGLAVLGFPCNQFMGQEPGSPEEIREFCSTNYGITFPMFAKLDVNGANRHPLYGILTRAADDDGQAGDVQWNFEKFLVSPDGTVLRRFRPMTSPEAPELIAAIEDNLPA
ncbi:MAG TPA: glutathione peroxidase [Candidatus Dormibacteraeota bacterium]|nr:glutathione peroxidase [Candidatus Dormibacteraeota bacterium]